MLIAVVSAIGLGQYRYSRWTRLAALHVLAQDGDSPQVNSAARPSMPRYQAWLRDPLPNRLFYVDNLDDASSRISLMRPPTAFTSIGFNSKSSYFVEHDGTTGHRRRSIMTLQKRRSKPSPSSCDE